MSHQRRLIVEQVGDETHVRFTEAKVVDKPNIEEIADELMLLVDRLGRRKLRLDLANVDYLSSFALGKLVSLHKKLQGLDGWLKLCNVPAKIYKVFEIAKLDEVLHLERLPEQEVRQA